VAEHVSSVVLWLLIAGILVLVFGPLFKILFRAAKAITAYREAKKMEEEVIQEQRFQQARRIGQGSTVNRAPRKT
jgi:Sec-independent protein translocase protein TatA